LARAFAGLFFFLGGLELSAKPVKLWLKLENAIAALTA
jgi:hypothetical protein